MNRRLPIILALAAGLGLGAGLTWLTLRGAGERPAGAPAAAQPPERKVLYWYDPMVPDQHFDKPGKSPFMDMDLVPKYADEAQAGTVAIDPRTVQNLGVRTAVAEEGRLWRRIDTVGMVMADENRVEVVQARAPGYVERLHVRAMNDPVRKGQLLAEVYSPALYTAQEEYRLALKAGDDPAWIAAARQKLLLLGVAEAQVAALEAGGAAQRRVAYHAPIAGVVSELAVREGASVSEGMPLMTLTDLSRVWVIAQVPEDQAAWVAPGKSAEVRLASRPGEVLEGRIDYLYPDIQRSTRTLQVRIVLDNPGLILRPGMYAEVTLYGGASRPAVLVPSEAVITTGRRSIVIVDEGQGRFRPVEVTPGIEHEGRTQILSGLAAGTRVVVSGQFLIESEANLKGVLARLAGPDETWKGMGVITHIDAKAGELEMAHDPIPALDWPAMTMGFEVRDPALLQGRKKGERVEFELARQGEGYVVVGLRPRSAQP